MRPWLVVVGIVFLTLGVGLVSTVYLEAAAPPATNSKVTVLPVFALGPNQTGTQTLEGLNGSTEQFQLAWHASAPVQVSLESPAGCASPTGPCWSEETLASWSGTTSGGWHGGGPFHYPLICLIRNGGPAAANVSVTGTALVQTPDHLSLLFEVVLAAGAAGLFIVGALAVFLGVFLRSDPYGPDPGLVSQSADDVEELAREAGPGH